MISNQDDDDRFDPIETMRTAGTTFIISLIIIAFIFFSALTCSAQSKEDYIKLIEGHGIEHPDIVYSQMMLESGNMNCKDCAWSNYNNVFGFHNGQRYLIYDNLEHALEGYKQWQTWRCPDCKTKDDYYNALIKFWGAPNMLGYINKLKQI